MRKFLVYILILTLIVACETSPIVFNGPNFVRFTETSLTEKESESDIIRIQVHNAGPTQEENVTIFYSVSGDAREGIDYEIVGTKGSVPIEAGEYFGYIEVRLINNANDILRSQDLILTLTSTSSSSLGIGQSAGGIGKKFTLTILDDCILGDTYIGKRGSSTVPDIEITSSDCEVYRLSNWDINIFGAADPVPLNFIDNGDNTLMVSLQQVEVFFGFYAIDIEVEGLGTVNPLTREIFLSLTFYDSGDTYSVNLTFLPS